MKPRPYDNESPNELNKIENADKVRKGQPVEIGANDGSQGGANDYNGNADKKVPPGFMVYSSHNYLSVKESNGGIYAHKHDGRWRCSFFAHPKE